MKFIFMFILVYTFNLYGEGSKYAFVLGNTNYKKNVLKNPTNDALDFSEKLKKIGFEVTLKINLNLNNMKKELKNFSKKIKKRDTVLFFYAGHAVQYNGRNFLLPINSISKISKPKKLLTETISLQYILTKINPINGLKIIILDSCRVSPFKKSFSQIKSGLTRTITRIKSKKSNLFYKNSIDSLEGSIIAYSTSPNKIALDGKGRNSPYTESLLKYIDKSNYSIEKILKLTRRNVKKTTKGQQTPWYENSFNGNFFPAGKDSIEFIDLLKLYALKEVSAGLMSSWRKGSSKYSPIEWSHSQTKSTSHPPYTAREGKVVITNNGKPSHFVLEKKLVPAKWTIKLFGLGGGFWFIYLYDNNGLLHVDSLNIDKKYIINEEKICQKNYSGGEKSIIKFKTIQLSKNSLILVLEHFLGPGGSTGSYENSYILYMNKPKSIKNEIRMKECFFKHSLRE